MVWKYQGGSTDLHVQVNGILAAVRYWNEIHRAITGAAGPGFLLVHGIVLHHVARVCSFWMMKALMSACSPDLNSLGNL